MSKDFGEFCAKVQYLVNKISCEHENVPVKVTNPIFIFCGQVSYALSVELNDAYPREAMVTVRWFDPHDGTNHETTVSVWDIDIVEWEVEKMKKEKGEDILREDGFILLWRQRLPELSMVEKSIADENLRVLQ